MVTIRSEGDLASVPAPYRTAVAAHWHSTQRAFAKTGFRYEPDRDGPFYYSDGDGAAAFDAIGLTWPPTEWLPEAVEPEDGLLVATFIYNNDYGVVVFFGPATLAEVRAALERDLDR